MRRVLGLFALLVLAHAQPFAPGEHGRVFAGPYLPLENPALLADLSVPRLYYRGSLVAGSRFSASAGAVWAGKGLALGGELGHPLGGSGYLGLARAGLGLAAALRHPGEAFGLGLGFSGEAGMGWGWLWLRGGRPELSLHFRRPWGRGYGLVGLELARRAVALRGVYGLPLSRGEERLWLWGGLGLSQRPFGDGLELALNARWQAPLFGGPIYGGLSARTGLELFRADAGAFSLHLLPVAVRADWRLRLFGGELRLRLPGLRLSLSDGRFAASFGFGFSGWLALR